MGKGVNKVILIGNLGQDPDVRQTAGGTAVVNLSIATSESWKDKQTGEKKEQTEWHRVVLFGKVAEIAGQYLNKGRSVYIEGRLQTRKYEKDGQTHYSTEIVGSDMQMLGGGEGGRESANHEPAWGADRKAPAAAGPDADFDDIPF